MAKIQHDDKFWIIHRGVAGGHPLPAFWPCLQTHNSLVSGLPLNFSCYHQTVDYQHRATQVTSDVYIIMYDVNDDWGCSVQVNKRGRFIKLIFSSRFFFGGGTQGVTKFVKLYHTITIVVTHTHIHIYTHTNHWCNQTWNSKKPFK